MKKTLWFALALLVCVTATTNFARADSESWNFTGTNSPGNVPCSSAAPCGQITLTTNGTSYATFTVSSLLSGYVFDSFGFNTTPGITLSLFSSSGEVNNPSLGGAGNEDGWGSFAHNFNTGKSGGSSGGDCAVSGGVPGAGCTFTFTVKCTNNCILSLSNFEVTSSGGNGTGYFAAHLAAGNGKTGYVGSPTQITQIDEPMTLNVMGVGLLTVGGLLRRRIFGIV
jgi:hypothetical protein